MSKKQKQQQEVMTAVSSVLSFIKERLTVDMKSAVDKKMISIDEAELLRFCELAKLSIDNSFYKSSTEISNSVK